LYIQRRNIKL